MSGSVQPAVKAEFLVAMGARSTVTFASPASSSGG